MWMLFASSQSCAFSLPRVFFFSFRKWRRSICFIHRRGFTCFVYRGNSGGTARSCPPFCKEINPCDPLLAWALVVAVYKKRVELKTYKGIINRLFWFLFVFCLFFVCFLLCSKIFRSLDLMQRTFSKTPTHPVLRKQSCRSQMRHSFVVGLDCIR